MIDLLAARNLDAIIETLCHLAGHSGTCSMHRVSRRWNEILNALNIWLRLFRRRYRRDASFRKVCAWSGWNLDEVCQSRRKLMYINRSVTDFPQLISHELPHPDVQIFLSNSPSCMLLHGGLLLCGTMCGSIKMWKPCDPDPGMRHCLRKVLIGHQGPVSALSGCDLRLASWSADCTLRIWCLEYGYQLRVLSLGLGSVCGGLALSSSRIIALLDQASGAGPRTVTVSVFHMDRYLDLTVAFSMEEQVADGSPSVAYDLTSRTVSMAISQCFKIAVLTEHGVLRLTADLRVAMRIVTVCRSHRLVAGILEQLPQLNLYDADSGSLLKQFSLEKTDCVISFGLSCETLSAVWQDSRDSRSCARKLALVPLVELAGGDSQLALRRWTQRQPVQCAEQPALVSPCGVALLAADSRILFYDAARSNWLGT